MATVAFLKDDEADAPARSAPSASAGAAARSTRWRSNSPDLVGGRGLLRPPAEAGGRAEDPGAALLLHYAGQDERINAGIDAYKAALEKRRQGLSRCIVYEGAQHAFNNDTSAARYDKEAADLAWGRTVAFLKEKLA